MQEFLEYNRCYLGVHIPQAFGAGAHTSQYLPIRGYERIIVMVNTGVIGAGDSIVVSVRESLDSNGVTEQELATMTFTATALDVVENMIIERRSDEFTDGYGYVAVRVTNSSAGDIFSATIIMSERKATPVSQSATLG